MPLNRRLLLSVLLPAGLALSARAQGSALGAALLEFEEAVTWEAVTADWRGLRPQWVAQAGAAGAPQDVAMLVMVLEVNMTWEAVQPGWRERRDPWIAELRAAGGEGDVARLLLELEEVTLWSAMDGSWRAARPGWVERVSAMAGAQAGTRTK